VCKLSIFMYCSVLVVGRGGGLMEGFFVRMHCSLSFVWFVRRAVLSFPSPFSFFSSPPQGPLFLFFSQPSTSRFAETISR
jgi:hypothetical protein